MMRPIPGLVLIVIGALIAVYGVHGLIWGEPLSFGVTLFGAILGVGSTALVLGADRRRELMRAELEDKARLVADLYGVDSYEFRAVQAEARAQGFDVKVGW